MPDTFKLKFGAPERVDAAAYTAGTMYLAKLDASTADLYFDMGGTRLQVRGFGHTLTEEQCSDFADQITMQLRAGALNDLQAIDMVDDIWTGEVNT